MHLIHEGSFMTLQIDPVIPAESLSSFDGIVLDVRDSEAFTQKRVAGAVRVPIEIWEGAAKDPPTTLANVAFWTREIGTLGIDGSRNIAVYDDGRMTEAARVWFLLAHFGADARIIDGGWRALQNTSLPFETGAADKVVPASFAARVAQGPVGLVERSELAARLGSDVRVLDARTAVEFSGKDLRKNARGGHLPGSIHLSHADLLRSDGRLKSAEELHDLLATAGFKPSDRIVTHCDGGGRAALAALAAVRAGFTNVAAYYLSFSDWSRDESCPVVKD